MWRFGLAVAIRSRNLLALSLPYVIAKIVFGSQPSSIRSDIALIKVVVFPLPAAPVINNGELRCLITCNCESVNSKDLLFTSIARTKFSFADFGLII